MGIRRVIAFGLVVVAGAGAVGWWRLRAPAVSEEESFAFTQALGEERAEEFARRLAARPALARVARDYAGRTPLMIAAQLGQPPYLRALLDAGAAVNDAGSMRTGSTPLHLAVERGCAECIRMLLQAGADPEIRDGSGRSALDLASTRLSACSAMGQVRPELKPRCLMR